MRTILFAAACSVLLLLAGCFAAFDDQPADPQVLRESRPVGNAKDLRVELRYDIGQFDITKAVDDSLFSFDLQYDGGRFNPKFDFDGAGDHASMRLDMNSKGMHSGRGQENDLTLRLSDKVSLDLDISSGVSESRLDLTGLEVRRLKLQGGVGRTEVTFGKPSAQPVQSIEVASGVGELIIHGLGYSQVERLKLDGGIGRAELDFSGDLAAAHIDCAIRVGIGQVRLLVPREANIEIQADGSFLSNISAPSFDRNGRVYSHEGGSGARIQIRIESGVGGVNVELI